MSSFRTFPQKNINDLIDKNILVSYLSLSKQKVISINFNNKLREEHVVLIFREKKKLPVHLTNGLVLHDVY